MIRYKRYASTLRAVSFLVVLGVLVTSSRSAPSTSAPANCPTCSDKIVFALTGDPERDAEIRALARDRAREVRAAIALTNADARARMFQSWQGTTLAVKDSIRDEATLAAHNAARTAFLSDPAAPADRNALFQKWLAPGGEVRCVGYYGSIESVTPNANGELVVINVSPRLVSKNRGVAFTTLTAVEAWQLGTDGRLTNLKSMKNPKRPSLVMSG